jgi:hypothetical protein
MAGAAARDTEGANHKPRANRTAAVVDSRTAAVVDSRTAAVVDSRTAAVRSTAAAVNSKPQ